MNILSYTILSYTILSYTIVYRYSEKKITILNIHQIKNALDLISDNEFDGNLEKQKFNIASAIVCPTKSDKAPRQNTSNCLEILQPKSILGKRSRDC